ncbi:sugar transferase [Mumia zhuanghuii]|uniref:Sugar transferase n=2 Tax=Mumia TaxID=1546255 RepID=A0ABW1QH84_9ACTN|nr:MULTISPECIES: sugar transferase [Mumia]KAA1425342.1 sugar transferase [Mumia zhuanghuii]
MRRLVEAVMALALLAALAPLLILIGVIVRIESGRPVIFRQVRVGRDGREFEILKFRTMRPEGGTAEGAVTVAGDPRITVVGGVLRRTKLDELPQLVNVLRGDMAFVGPRPELPRYVALWPDELRWEILSVAPGITDPASIAFRDEPALLAQQREPERYYREIVLPQKATMYAEYVRGRCLRTDLRIVARTVEALVAG